MGLQIWVSKPRSRVILGKRTNPPGGREPSKADAEDAEAFRKLGQPDFAEMYGVTHWRNSDENTWPESLQFFWNWMHTSHDARVVAKDIRFYYPEDLQLLDLAEWLDFWADKGADFRPG